MSGKRKTPSHENGKSSKVPKSLCVDLHLSSELTSASAIEHLTTAWRDRTDNRGHPVTEIEARYCSTPFRHCVLSNFIQEEDILKKLQVELLDLYFTEKNNDLYKFHQSKTDLKTAAGGYIQGFRKLLCTTFRDWLIAVTGIPLNETVDAFCAQYNYTDTLLCHDDELEGRRIAYIYYLVNNWSEEDGGALDLFSVDDNIQPKEVVKSILPEKNMFAFFEVTPGSYHQVAEILTEHNTRLSISGWFHGPPVERPPPYKERPRSLHSCGFIEEEVFFDWINPEYLDVGTQSSIQEKFGTDSEIELQDFLQREKYEALLEALKSAQTHWKKMGPANKRCYDQADEDTYPDIVRTCVSLFKSDAMFLLLSNLTGLKLHELAPSNSDDESQALEEIELEKSGAAKSGSSGETTVQTDSPVSGLSGNKVGKDKESSHTDETNRRTDSKKEDSKKERKEVEQNDSEDSKCTAQCRTEVRHWKHRYYTLLHDTDTEGSEFALDLVLYVGCEGWKMEYGGFTSYIAKGEDEELLTVTPRENSLALVYRDQDTLKFVKYVNNQVNNMQGKGFFDVSAVYYE